MSPSSGAPAKTQRSGFGGERRSSALLAVPGPVVLRLVYEGTMMLILMVKNVIEIYNKLSGPKDSTASAPTEE